MKITAAGVKKCQRSSSADVGELEIVHGERCHIVHKLVGVERHPYLALGVACHLIGLVYEHDFPSGSEHEVVVCRQCGDGGGAYHLLEGIRLGLNGGYEAVGGFGAENVACRKHAAAGNVVVDVEIGTHPVGGVRLVLVVAHAVHEHFRSKVHYRAIH